MPTSHPLIARVIADCNGIMGDSRIASSDEAVNRLVVDVQVLADGLKTLTEIFDALHFDEHTDGG